MAYNKYTWTASSLLSGRRFNYLETQWDEIKSDADAHIHDDRYYTKTLAGTTFFSSTFYTGFDADMLDGKHYADVVSETLPVGCIAMWSGSPGTIPEHWGLCDGTTYDGRVSPDLRDRFVVGAGDTYTPGATGGPAAYDDDITPTVSVTIGAHQLTTSEIPSHTHTWSQECPANVVDSDGASSAFRSYQSQNSTISAQTVGDGTHGHTGSTLVFDPIASRPPYFALCYVMKYE